MTDDETDFEAVHTASTLGFKPLHTARQMVAEKRYREAHAFCRNLAEQDPDTSDAFYVLGIIAYEHKDYVRALRLFEVAVARGHPEAGPHIQAARCLAQLGRPKEALSNLDAARKLNPVDSFSLSSIAVTLSWLDRHDEAVTFHRRATEAAPDSALNFFNLGSSLQFMGEFAEAREAYRTSLQLDPGYAPALAHLTLITHHTPEDNTLPMLQEAWQQRDTSDVSSSLQIAHAIAKVHEDLDDPQSAMTWLDTAKSIIRQRVPDRRARDKASFEAARALATTLKQKTDMPADGPLFIVGLPRTGTTLVDRILSSHSQVTSAGERAEFGTSLYQSAGPAGGDVLDARIISGAAEIDLSIVGKAYTEALQAILGTPQRFTDKMPVNAFFVPAILAALPASRIICLRRHPADSVLSIYRQYLTAYNTYYRYTYDLHDLAEYVAEFHGLIEAYTEALPPSRFTVVDYESLVGNPEAGIRRLLEFSGLDFEPACLDFHNNSAPVATASVAQVRKPIYTSSTGRWKRYRAQLEPALKILRDRGRLDPED